MKFPTPTPTWTKAAPALPEGLLSGARYPCTTTLSAWRHQTSQRLFSKVPPSLCSVSIPHVLLKVLNLCTCLLWIRTSALCLWFDFYFADLKRRGKFETPPRPSMTEGSWFCSLKVRVLQWLPLAESEWKVSRRNRSSTGSGKGACDGRRFCTARGISVRQVSKKKVTFTRTFQHFVRAETRRRHRCPELFDRPVLMLHDAANFSDHILYFFWAATDHLPCFKSSWFCLLRFKNPTSKFLTRSNGITERTGSLCSLKWSSDQIYCLYCIFGLCFFYILGVKALKSSDKSERTSMEALL